MALLTRRRFLRGALAAIPAGSVVPAVFQRALASAHYAASRDNASRTLIVVQLAGGNDGLNTVVPFADPVYAKVRPTLAIPRDQVIDLDGRLGLHPSLKPLKEHWDAGHVAIVENVGYPSPNLSHFVSTDIWQFADPGLQRHQGWLATSPDGQGSSPGSLPAVSLGSGVSAAFSGAGVPPPALSSPAAYRFQPDSRHPAGQTARLDALHRLYGGYDSSSPFASLLKRVAATAEDSSAALHDAVAAYTPTATFPQGAFGDGLKLLAALVSGDVGLRVGYITIGGFDTHSGEAGPHARLLTTVADGLAALLSDLDAHGKGDDVLLMTWSEFGRRVGENASGGTDHGTAAPLFVLGKGVRAGIQGDPPDLAKLDGGNLRYAIDFRSVYATVLEGWLGLDAVAALGQQFPKVGFL